MVQPEDLFVCMCEGETLWGLFKQLKGEQRLICYLFTWQTLTLRHFRSQGRTASKYPSYFGSGTSLDPSRPEHIQAQLSYIRFAPKDCQFLFI
jgi:hypothetical protein